MDPVSVREHATTMLTEFHLSKLLATMGLESDATTTLDETRWPLQIDSYTYAGVDPLKWTDNTGKDGQVIVNLLRIGYACWATYCGKRAIDMCAKAYPNHNDPEDRKSGEEFWNCVKPRLDACLTLGIYGADPFSSAASTAGEEVGKKCTKCSE